MHKITSAISANLAEMSSAQHRDAPEIVEAQLVKSKQNVSKNPNVSKPNC